MQVVSHRQIQNYRVCVDIHIYKQDNNPGLPYYSLTYHYACSIISKYKFDSQNRAY